MDMIRGERINDQQIIKRKKPINGSRNASGKTGKGRE
jgi:hypothetical protein